MESLVRKEIIKNLNKDIADIKKQYEILNKESSQELEALNINLGNVNKEFVKVHDDYIEHIGMPKEEIKKDKKSWKLKKKEYLKNKKEIRTNYLLLSEKISEKKLQIDRITKNMDEDLFKLNEYANEQIKEISMNDSLIINKITISALATKIKITIKDYEIQKITSNPRVGFSLGTNFKPRVFVSTNAKTRTKKIMTQNESFDIRKKDLFEDRIIEIAEYLDIVDPSNLYNYVVNTVKVSQGSQYLKEFNI